MLAGARLRAVEIEGQRDQEVILGVKLETGAELEVLVEFQPQLAAVLELVGYARAEVPHARLVVAGCLCVQRHVQGLVYWGADGDVGGS